ncbi:MAG TPA: ABC-2 family transporter protein [Thermomicrobiales bacterium]|nr:ABC-2 family transporter protein [Thermomicrobiales bacterium]
MWPVGLYPPWLRATLRFLVPIAFAITVPASSLVGRLDWRVFGGTAVLAGIMLIASRCFWTRGVRHYAGASV